jgi:hypothetical protein
MRRAIDGRSSTPSRLVSRKVRGVGWNDQARELIEIIRKADDEVAVQLLAHTLELVEQTGICLGLDQGRQTFDRAWRLY